jgi:hypothetical protein
MCSSNNCGCSTNSFLTPISIPGRPGIPGLPGLPGLSIRGLPGPQGTPGIEGPIGPQGTPGIEGPIGPQGTPGIEGPIGPQGTPGLEGPIGPQGTPGIEGPIGPQGIQGPQGVPGIHGLIGSPGVAGPIGPQGATGPQGPSGILNCSDFYALMPEDNTATIAPGTAVSFPKNGVSNSVITRLNSTQFNLPKIGTYQITFQVSINEPGQLVIVLNNSEISSSIVGRATGTSNLIGVSLLSTTIANSVLSINNPSGNSTALTITPLAGGKKAVSAHLVIVQLI